MFCQQPAKVLVFCPESLQLLIGIIGDTFPIVISVEWRVHISERNKYLLRRLCLCVFCCNGFEQLSRSIHHFLAEYDTTEPHVFRFVRTYLAKYEMTRLDWAGR